MRSYELLTKKKIVSKNIEDIIEEVSQIYQNSRHDAEKYLKKARKLETMLGSGPAIVYCWFYSIPQKWKSVEPKIFELMNLTSSFDLETISLISTEKVVPTLKSFIFPNEILRQLKNFCYAVKEIYSTWEKFSESIYNESIFDLFKVLRKYNDTRITFKNLSAMKIFVGMEDDFLILDTHVSRVLGIRRQYLHEVKTNIPYYKGVLEFSELISNGVGVPAAKWSLSIWFEKAKISADELLTCIKLTHTTEEEKCPHF